MNKLIIYHIHNHYVFSAMQLQAVCDPYINCSSNLGGFHPNVRLFSAVFHSKSGQYKSAKTVKVDISSSYLTPVLFKECDEIDKPILIFLQILILQKAYRGCMCTVSGWASEHYTSVTHGSCVTPPRHVTGKLAWAQAKWYWDCRPGGHKPPPNVLGQSVLAERRRWSRVPCWMGVPISDCTRSHCVYMCPSLAVFGTLCNS